MDNTDWLLRDLGETKSFAPRFFNIYSALNVFKIFKLLSILESDSDLM